MDWGGYNFPATAGLTGSLAAGLVSGMYVLPPTFVRSNLSDPTLIRTLLSVSAELYAGTLGQVMYGLIAWDDINDTPDEMPDPWSHPNLDWIITGVFHGVGHNTAAQWFTGVGESGAGWIESSAMRRLGNTKGLLVVVANMTNSSIAMSIACRYLIKE